MLNAVSWLDSGFVCLTDEDANRDIVLVLSRLVPWLTLVLEL